MAGFAQNSVLNRFRALDKRHPTTVDLVTLFVIPTVVLSSIYFLWPASERVLEYKARNPTLIGILGSNLAHRSAGHLTRNLIGLWLFGGFGYLLARSAGKRDFYRLSFVSYLTVLPFLASPFIRRMLADTPAKLAKLESVGFSQTVGAITGFLAIAIALYYYRVTEGDARPDLLAIGLFFGGFGAFFQKLGGNLDVTVLTVGIGILTLIYIGVKGQLSFEQSFRSVSFWATVGGVLLFYLAIGGLFNPQAGGGIYGHLAGYWWGFILSGLYLLLTETYRRIPGYFNGQVPFFTL